MKNKSKFLSATLAILIVVLSGTSAFAASVTDYSAEYNKETGYVTLGGKTPYGKDSRVSVSVTHPLLAKPFYIGETSAGNNGDFNFKIKMDKQTDESGYYTVYFGGGNLDTSDASTFFFISDVDNTYILESVNGKTEGMTGIIDEVAGMCGIERGEGTHFYSLSDDGKTAVYNAMTDRTFATAYDIRGEFDKAALLQAVKETGSVDLIMNNASTLGIDIGEDSYYASLSPTSQTRVTSNLGTEFSLRDTSEIQIAFDKAVYVELINELDNSNKDKLIDYLSECITKKYTDISLDEYNSTVLDDTDRQYIISGALTARESGLFESLDDVKSAFESAIKDVKEGNEGIDTDIKEPSKNNNKKDNGFTIKIDSNIPNNVEIDKNPEIISTTYTDLGSVSWAVESIEHLSKKNIISGVGGNKFDPNRAVTREEFVKMLTLALNIPADTTAYTFSDVKSGAWYYDYVMNAYANGIINGIDESNFGVGKAITREEICTIINRAQNLMNINIESDATTVAIKDADKISDWAKEAVESLYRAEIVNGMGDGNFAPKAPATRAMAAKIIYLLMERGRLL